MLKLYLFTPFIICGVLTLGGCQKNSDNGEPYLVVPVSDVSEQKFMADDKDASHSSASTSAPCDNHTKGKVDSRLAKGAVFTKISNNSGSVNMTDTYSSQEIVKVYNMTDDSFNEDHLYTYSSGSSYSYTQKCDLGKDSSSSSISCSNVGQGVSKWGGGRGRMHRTRGHGSYCYFSYASPYEPAKTTVETGHYTLDSGKVVVAKRTKSISTGRLMCDQKDSGVATQIQTEIETHDIPNEEGWICSAYTAYRYTKVLDGNNSHVNSESTELTNYVEGQ